MGISSRVRGISACLIAGGLLAVACGGDDDAGSVGSAGQSDGGSSAGEQAAAGDGGAADPSTNPNGGSTDAGAGGAADDSLASRLDHLGAKTNLPKLPAGEDGKAVPDGYHPLKKTYAVIDPRQETFYSGPLLGAQREGVLDDGFTGAFASMYTPQLPTAFDAPFRAGVAADVDGDGIQEFVLIYYDVPSKGLWAKVTYGPHGNKQAHDEAPFMLAPVTTVTNMPADWFQHGVAAGNVDDDPADELVVAFNDVYFFDDMNHKMAEIKAAHDTLNSDVVSVTKGDFDAKLMDPTDEFAVMFRGAGNVQRFQVYDGTEKTLGPSGRGFQPTLLNKSHSELKLHQGFAVAAQLDHDPQQELAVLSGDDYAWRFMIIDDASTMYHSVDSFIQDQSGHDVTLAAADIDGDGIDEVFCVDWLYDQLEKLPGSGDATPVEDPDIYQEKVIKKINPLIDPFILTSGHISPDLGEPELQRADQFLGLANGALLFSARNPTKQNELTWVSLGSVSQTSATSVLATGNIDSDSAIVRFTGEHELKYAKPELLVALAAPPFYADTNQEGNSSTSFGKSDGTSVEKESSVGYSVGFSFGYESEDPLGIAKASFKISVNQEFDSTAKTASLQNQVVTYSGGPEDSVVFTVVPFDVYYYEVISALDASTVGTTLAINLPRKPQTLLATSDYFDRYVDASRKSRPLFGTHTVGDPLSYSTLAQRDMLCGGHCFKSSEAIAVGQGNGSTTLEISQGDQEGTGYSYKLSTEVESEASLFGVSVGASAGFSYGYSLEATTEETTIFTGQLGSLEGLTPANAYSAGIFAHQQAHPASIKPVLVVDYWVEQ